jgi:type II secretory pathway component GspD/PulD (secretin)
MKQDKDLAALIAAYERQSAQAAAQREHRLQRGIRRLAVSRPDPAVQPVVSADLEGAALSVVIPRLLGLAGVPYVLDNVVLRGTVTARFENLPLLRAVSLLLQPQGLMADQPEGVLQIRVGWGQDEAPAASPGASKVGPSPELAGKAATPSAPSISVNIPLENLHVEAAAKTLESLFPANPTTGARLVQYGIEPQTNTVILKGPAEGVAQAAQIVRQMDCQPSHVVIEVLVVEFDSNALQQLGADLRKFAKGQFSELTTNIGSLTGQAATFMFLDTARNSLAFTALINLLVSQDKARLISRPYLATVSGRPANINITLDRYVIVQTPDQGLGISTVQAVSSGVILEIRPTVMGADRIRVEIKVEDSGFVPPSGNVAVEVDKNEAQTTMHVESGQSVIIGGLVLNRATDSNAGLPWLRHVPLLDLAFAKRDRETTKQEVMVLVTPHIWTPGLVPPLVEPNAFTIPEEPERLSPFERFER